MIEFNIKVYVLIYIIQIDTKNNFFLTYINQQRKWSVIIYLKNKKNNIIHTIFYSINEWITIIISRTIILSEC